MKLLVCAVSLVFFTGCLQVEIDKPGDIIPSRDPCACSGGTSWAARNLNPYDPLQMSYIKYTRPRGSSVPFVPEAKTILLGPKETKFIGCTYEPDPPSASACDTEVTFGLPDAALYARTQQQMYRALARGTDARLYCLDICPIDHPYSNCLQARKGSSFAKDFGGKLTRLHARLMDASTVKIEARELLNLFGLDRDECARGETTIADGKLYNSGPTGCKIEAKLRLPRKSAKSGRVVETVRDEKVELIIPPDVTGEFKRLVDNTASMSYSALNAPTLVFPGRLDEVFGGGVRSIIVQPKRILLEALNGCTDIPLE